MNYFFYKIIAKNLKKFLKIQFFFGPIFLHTSIKPDPHISSGNNRYNIIIDVLWLFWYQHGPYLINIFNLKLILLNINQLFFLENNGQKSKKIPENPLFLGPLFCTYFETTFYNFFDPFMALFDHFCSKSQLFDTFLISFCQKSQIMDQFMNNNTPKNIPKYPKISPNIQKNPW